MRNPLHDMADGLIDRDKLVLAIRLHIPRWAHDAVMISQAMSAPTGVTFPPSHFFGYIHDMLQAMDMWEEARELEAEFKRACEAVGDAPDSYKANAPVIRVDDYLYGDA